MPGLKITKALPLSAVLAVLTALGGAACGPMAENLPKTLLHQTDDHSAPPSLLATGPSTSQSEDEESMPLAVDETHFLAPSAFQRFVSDSVYRSVPRPQRIEISDLSSLRQDNGSLTLSTEGFLAGSADSKIIVVVEMRRPAVSIPAREYLPVARLSLAPQETATTAPILTLSFTGVEDPAAATTAELLSDANRIFIYRR